MSVAALAHGSANLGAQTTSAPYCGRFAPSPTGPLHFGSLVTAVGSFLDARAHGGRWLVRIDDLDAPRVVPGAADAILRTLEAFGLTWDGAVVYQSQRLDVYRAAFERLRTEGIVYPCSCSRKEIADSALSRFGATIYPGTCRHGLAPGRVARAWRVDTRGVVMAFEDRLQGPQRYVLEEEVGDYVVWRADGVFAYQLAAAVDDADGVITDVVRGADLLDSTPRQIFLQQRLGLSRPRYLHLPVVVNAAGEKLSKQTHAPALDPRHASRQLIEALHFLGQPAPTELARASVAEVWAWALAHWDIERVPKVRTRFWVAVSSRSEAR